ncbi:lipoprotein-anchoring transpeptidase ErfK/SrfK [Prosthecobacter fusiformis]|uniref:Lipoprotein-anchoring transpeptidase ErfK/SrfK n=1 Tax=Prosthecobacter fusiformis TaxID=48464 RepID=A0A4R7SRM7_9BACT|nr:L,D-transpeptidase family protein [Prosthecobacter fusiformis]TDU81634.1 lipoprotein-anchoring transpeptidase ErfK/SrfK [Prosthecobacter fusiformis]
MNIARLTLAALAGCTLCACQMPTSFARQEVIRRPLLIQPADSSSSPLYVWHGLGEPGPVRVTIDLSEQKAYIFRNSENVAWSYVATGRSGHRTPTGSFVISEKVVNKRSNKYGSIVDASGDVIRSNATAGVHSAPGGKFQGAKMPYWMRLTGDGVGMHAGPIPNPGSPASHGCIRLPYDMAQRLYDVAPSGTRVTIVP